MTQGFVNVNNGGTVTSVATTGLASGGPITSSGTIDVVAAVKSDQTTGTSTSVAVVPGVQQYHASATKVWGRFTQSGGTYTLQDNYNISSFVKNGTGSLTISFTTSFADSNYPCIAGVTEGTNAYVRSQVNSVSSVGTQAITTDGTSDNIDVGFSISAWGPQ